MLLPASYLNGFAPRDGQPLYPSLWKGCVGAWNPGLGPTGLTLRDWSGKSLNGTLTNFSLNSAWTALQGKYALLFDGTNDVVASLGNVLPSVSSSTSFSYSQWAYFTAVPGVRCSITPIPAINSNDFGAEITVLSNGKLTIDASKANVSNVRFSMSTNVLTGQWLHIVGTWDSVAQVATLWQNGVSQGTVSYTAATTSATAVNTTSWFIGCENFAGSNGNFMSGYLDDFLVYNRALSPDEIRTLSTRRGIAYEMAPRRRSSAQVTVAPLRYNLFSGSIGNTDVIGAS